MKERDVAGMRCSEVLALLSEYVDGELDSAVVERIEAHLRGCPNCEQFGKNFGSMIITLRNHSETFPKGDAETVSQLLQYLREANAHS